MKQCARGFIAILPVLAACSGEKPTAPVAVASVSISASTTMLPYAQTMQLAATVLGVNGNQLPGRPVTWGSSNDAIATVSSTGLVTAGTVRGGTAEPVTITATSEGRTGSVTLAILPIPVSVIKLSLSQVSLFVGQTAQLGVTLEDATSGTLTGREVRWSTSSAGLATVSTTGLITALAPGAVTITATAEGKTATSNLSVRARVPASLRLSTDSIRLLSGDGWQFSVVAKDSVDQVIDSPPVEWSVSTGTSASARINGSGLMTSDPLLSGGDQLVRVVARSGTVSDTALVTLARSYPAVRFDFSLYFSNRGGYSRLEQFRVPLTAGETYQFSVRLLGRVQLSTADDVGYAVGSEWVTAANRQVVFDGIWTTITAVLRPTRTELYLFGLAFWPGSWNGPPPIVSDISLRDSRRREVIHNGDLTKGLSWWLPTKAHLYAAHAAAARDASMLPWPQPTRDLSGLRRCTSQRASPLQVDGRVDGKRVRYQGMSSAPEELVAYEDSLITLLVPSTPAFEPWEIREIACRLNTSWTYFTNVTGFNPPAIPVTLTVDGVSIQYTRPTLAVAVSGRIGGAGVGYSGAAGIAVGSGIWQQTLENFRAGMETRGVFEYEMGRNFWAFGGKGQSPRPEDGEFFHWATDFATLLGHLAGVAAGAPMARGNENADWINQSREAFGWYLKYPDFQAMTTVPLLRCGTLLYLHETYGSDFLPRFFRALADMPNATSVETAAQNFAAAASVGAQRDLSTWFRQELKFP
jgi:hypothetical protein